MIIAATLAVTATVYDAKQWAQFDEIWPLLSGFGWLLGLLVVAAMTLVRARPSMRGSA